MSAPFRCPSSPVSPRPPSPQRLADSRGEGRDLRGRSLRRGQRVRCGQTLDEARPRPPARVAWEHVGTSRRGRELARRGSPGTLAPLEVDSEHPYLLTYTSGTTGQAEGRRSTCTAASSSRSPARSPTRRTCSRATSSTSPPTWAGSWARGRSSARARSGDDRLRRGRARLARRPALAARRGRARDDPRPLADARPRADPARRPAGRPLVAARDRARPASRGTPSRIGGSSSSVGGGALPIVNISGGTEVGACFLSPTPASRSRRARSASRRSAMAWTSSTRTVSRVRGEVGELVCRDRCPE